MNLFSLLIKTDHSRSSSQDLASLATESVERSQVVAVGTPLPTASLPAGAHQGPVMVTTSIYLIRTNQNALLNVYKDAMFKKETHLIIKIIWLQQ